MLRARHMVGERVRSIGKESVFDLSGMNRGAGIGEEEVPHLTSHVPFFERFEGRTEPYALRHKGAEPKRHKALIINRADAIARTLRSPDVVDGLAKQGATAGALTQPQFADYVSAEVDKWAKVVKESGAKID